MQQWREIKSRHQDSLVFFRVGDFYEMFYEDAIEGAKLLDLTLTSRNNGSSRAPLAGLPIHAAEGYLQRLVEMGRRVAICEQVEDASEAKGLVRREVTELITPGVVFSDAVLDARRNNYLLAVAGGPDDRDLGIAAADLTTGEVVLERAERSSLGALLARYDPSELLLETAWQGEPLAGDGAAVRTYRGSWLFDAGTGAEEIRRHFGVLNLAGFGLGEGDDLLVAAAGALVGYVREVQPVRGAHLRPPRVERGGGAMILDDMTRRNLELVEPIRPADGTRTLLDVLDRAGTAMGARLLRRWILSPLLDRSEIERRLEAVEELVEGQGERSRLRSVLSEIRDLERLAVKVASGRAAPRELLAVGASISRLPGVREVLDGLSAPMLATLRDGLDPLDDVGELIAGAISPDAPAVLGEGGVIREGFDAELDGLREARDGARNWIARLQARERERTGIGSLKVGFNKVFGYYLEVSRAKLDQVPDDYDRRQTLSNAERYITPELKEWEQKVLGAEEKIEALEQRLFARVRAQVAGEVARLQAVADRIGTLDVLATLAEVAAREEYVRPEVDDGFDLEIQAGRHPVVETMMPREEFIPNDVRLTNVDRVMILTGPNMAGKSTVLRQVGLTVLLAQMGSFVPAGRARVAIVDRLFTRVGASDNLALGQSTFMVEMTETAAILNAATERSLVLLDEIGRGTSTWDGLSVATATTEFVHDRIGAKTIFATHYHELTALAERCEGVFNRSVSVREEGDAIVFLRTLVDGGADRSYGVEVARLAGLPAEVVRRARQILATLETNGSAAGGRMAPPPPQLALFEGASGPHPVVSRLRETRIDRITPLEALNLLDELVRAAGE
jgi:DNA mismatch repair protein MutS